MNELGTLLGRLHPAVVHLPIGILVLAGVLHVLGRTDRFAAVASAVRPALAAGALTAHLAAATGMLHASMGGYAGTTVWRHQVLGIALAWLATAAALAYPARGWRVGATSRRRAGLSHALVALTLGLVAGAGHFGGMVTHGDAYLYEVLPPFLRRAPDGPAPGTARQAVVYAAAIQPVLNRRCVSCHGPDKAEGKLRLDTAEGVRRGGSDGPVIVAGRPDASELLRRIWLPVSHKDAMPPRGRTPLTVAEAALLRWWVATGASFDARVQDVELTPEVEPVLEALLGPIEPGTPAILAVEVPAPPAAAVQQASASGLTVSPLASGASFLQVDATNVRAAFGDEELKNLLPLAQQVTWLSLAGTRVTDVGVAVLARFPNLTRLRLDGTAVTDGALAHLSSLQRLEYLNLRGTNVTDAGLAALSQAGALRDLYLWQTGVTPAGVERLRAQLPRVRVVLGTELPEDASAEAPVAGDQAGERGAAQ